MKTNFFSTVQRIVIRVFFIFAVSIFSVCLVQTATAAIDDTVPLRQPAQTIYTEEQLQDLMGPSIVRIIQHIEGKAQIPSFVIDIENRTISLDNGDPIVFDDIDENIIGTGFIVSPNGHILTNAHFVSDVTSKLAIITPYVQTAVQEAEDVVSESIEDDMAFGLDILDFVIENSTFELNKKIIVIDPQTQVNEVDENTFFDISKIGLPASISYVNDNFYKGDGSNLAVIKIKGKNFPSSFIPDENISTLDDDLYAFNTLGVYDLKNINDFKSGGVYDFELKSSSVATDKIDIDILHTNIKFNSGASGGPSFNANGDIVGILAFEGKTAADTLAQIPIIPNSIIRTIFNKIGIANEEGAYATHFKKGFEYINSERCDEASGEFEKALFPKSPFTKNVVLNSYLVECYKASKLSEESQTKNISWFLNTIKESSVSLDLLDWIIIVLLVLLGITLLVIFIVMMGRFRKKKEEPYRPSKESRSEEMQKARRVSLSEVLPKQRKEISARPIGSDVVLSSDKISSQGVSQNSISKQEIVPEIKNDNEKTSARRNLKNTKTQNTKSILDNNSPSEFLQTISKEDRERLSELWPKKYNIGKTDDLIDVEKTPKKKATEEISDTNSILTKYIQETRALGFSNEDISQELERAGWKSEDINRVFDEV